MIRACSSSPWEVWAGSRVQGQAGLLKAETEEREGRRGEKGKKDESYWFYLIF